MQKIARLELGAEDGAVDRVDGEADEGALDLVSVGVAARNLAERRAASVDVVEGLAELGGSFGNLALVASAREDSSARAARLVLAVGLGSLGA